MEHRGRFSVLTGQSGDGSVIDKRDGDRGTVLLSPNPTATAPLYRSATATL